MSHMHELIQHCVDLGIISPEGILALAECWGNGVGSSIQNSGSPSIQIRMPLISKGVLAGGENDTCSLE